MAIRLRSVEGVRVALCAVETDAMAGDVYLDDADHYALAAKFARDLALPSYPREWAAMDSQKLRDAEQELIKWQEWIKCTPTLIVPCQRPETSDGR